MTTTAAEAKMKKALAGIARYVEKKKPRTFAEAVHMLTTIGVLASETLAEVEPA